MFSRRAPTHPAKDMQIVRMDMANISTTGSIGDELAFEILSMEF